jgi:glutaminase
MQTELPAPAAPDSPIQSYLQGLHQRFAGLHSGQVATYIPELAKVDPALFGIVIATVDGQVYEVGAARAAFTIQSISKPLVYGVALEDHGRDRVRQSIGVEPSGDAFNSISLEPTSGRPLNPMINAGAIATTGLVKGADGEARLQRVLDAIAAFAGRPLGIDDSVFESERSTGHRNRAIGHMLRNYEILTEDPEAALDLYFQQCSIVVDCRDLALIAATLANGGVHPVSGQRAMASEHISDILSVMTTCGMYDFAGEWVTRVGMPAKSGVGGGIIAVLPGQLGIGVFSPALDERGNSVRGVKVCEAISADLGLHFLRPPRAAAATVRARYTVAQVRSKRRRSPADNSLLEAHGAGVVVHELQGDLRFATLEPVIRDLAHHAADASMPAYAVLDFKRVTHADEAATRLLARLVEHFGGRGRHLVLSRVRRGKLLDGLGAELDPRYAGAMSFQPQLDLALEWCERQLLQRHGVGQPVNRLSGLHEHQLCAGLSAAELDTLQVRLQRHSHDPGSLLFQRGDAADCIYLMLRGEVSVVVSLPGGAVKRLSTLSAGMSFGEAALLRDGTRSADVRADSPVECATLSRDAFQRLEAEHPALAIKLLRNLMHSTADTAVRLTAEVSALEA